MNLDRDLRPTKFKDYISSNNEGIVKDIKGFIKTGDPPHFLFVGPPGCGKNTLYWIFATQFLGRKINIDTEEGDREYKEINAGKDRGIDTVRNEIAEFASFVLRDHKKCCLVDEFDNPTPQMQLSLKNLIESQANNCHFCFIANDDSKIIDALKSRCYIGRFSRPKKDDIGEWFVQKAKLYGVEFESLDLVADIVEFYGGDFRKMLVDCLEALRGRVLLENRKINEEDLWKIFRGGTRNIARKVLESDSPIDTWVKYWKMSNFDNRKFLEDYFGLVKKKARLFAKIDSRLRRGCNPLIQMSALFDIL